MRPTDVTDARQAGITGEPPAPQKPESPRPSRRPLIFGVAALLAALVLVAWVFYTQSPPQTERGVTEAIVEALRHEGKGDIADEADATGFTWKAETEQWNCRGRGFSISYHPATRRINVMIFYAAGRTDDTGVLRKTLTGKWAVTWEQRARIRKGS
jgi:hypothetical protein